MTQLRELLVEANADALNRTLGSHNIAAEQVLAVMLVPGQRLGLESPAPRYKVVYRG